MFCITIFEKDECIKERYIVQKNNNIKIKVIVETQGLSEEDNKRLGWVIRKGKFEDIKDIAQEFEIIRKDK